MAELLGSLKDKVQDTVEEKLEGDDQSDDDLEQDEFDADEAKTNATQKQSKADKKKEETALKNRKSDTKVINAGGDFQVQVHVIEARELRAKDSSGTSDPVVTVTIFDHKKSTTIIEKKKECRWDQVLYFELNGLLPDELSRGTALIEVHDADIFGKELIGAFEFDLAWIYYRKHHEVYNQWIALSNTQESEEDEEEKDDDDDASDKSEEGMDGIEGYLKLSVTVLGPNDEQYIHDEEAEEAKQGGKLEKGMILISPGIEQTPYLLTIKIYKARHLCKTDDDTIFSKMAKNTGDQNLDPFFYVEYAGVRLRSNTYKGVNADCQVGFKIPVMEPVFSDNIIINVVDYDKLSRNDRIGCLKISYLKLKKEHNMKIEPCWMFFYGAPRGYQRGYARKMNQGLVEGSNFRGMLYLEASLTKCEKKPRKKVVESINLPLKEPQMVEYYLRADVYEGTEINRIKGFGDEMFVQIEVCNCIARSSEKKIPDANATVKWYESLISDGGKKLKCIGPFYLPLGWNENPEPVQLPDVFIYLCVKEFGGDIEQVSYCRVPLSQIIRPAPSGKGTHRFTTGATSKWDNGPVWHDMKENQALDKYADNIFPGAVLIGLNAGPKDDLQDDQKQLMAPPSLARPFSNDALFKEVPTDKTPEPPSPAAADVSSDEEFGGDGDSKQNEQQQQQSKRKRALTHARLTIDCIQGSNLPAMDGGLFKKSVTSDPYCEVVIQSQSSGKRVEKEIEPIKKTLNPIWNQSLAFDVEIGDTLFLRVMDWDAGPDPDDEMCSIQPMTLSGVDFGDRWFDLRPSKEAMQKYKKKPDKLKNMKLKLSMRFEMMEAPEKKESASKKLGAVFKKVIPKKKAKKPEFETSKLSEPSRRTMELRAHIFQAKGLKNADASGLSDAYMKVRFCGNAAQTKTVIDSIDPKWYQTLRFTVNVPTPLRYAPRIYCEIYDEDDLGKDESLGRLSIESDTAWKVLQDANQNKLHDDAESREDALMDLSPRWYPLYDAEHNVQDGSEVLCAFELIDIKQAAIETMSIKPKMNRRRWLHIHTLGLRDIQSTFGCHKPYVQFELVGNKYETSKSNQPDSKNPNFCQILKFEVRLPEKDIFLPNLNLKVYDALFGGLIKRVLGYASVEVEDLIDMQRAMEYFGQTEQQLELNSIRNAAAEKLADYEQKQQSEHKAAEEEQHEEAGQGDDAVISFSTEDANDESQHLLVGKQAAGAGGAQDKTTTNDKELLKLEHKQKAKEEGLFAAYEWTNKDTYDLSKVQPDYMKNRTTYDDELEDKLSLKPFLKIPFFSGKSAKRRTVGYFKGLMSFTEHKSGAAHTFKYLKDITNATDLYLRVYILRGTKLIPRDTNGSSDPYLKLRLGKSRFSTRNSYHNNTLEPGFYECFEMPIKMPGASKLDIEVWDWDGIGDDLIGRTTVDIEDRWFSETWRELKLKPVETRTLWAEASTVSQGKLTMWMEIMSPSDAKKYPPVDISPPTQVDYELRVIVWQCKDCPIMDEITKMNDLYITGELSSTVEDENNTQQTDLHFRSQSGCGSFNWRMKFPIKLPKQRLSEYPRFTAQIWDKDFFSPNDNIAECTIELKPFLRYCEKYSKDKRCVLEYGNQDKFWIDLAQKGGGKVELSFELLPDKVAKALPAGLGRDAPNNNPYLPEPEGRAQFSLFHPCRSLRLLLGDQLCCKIVCLIICVLVIALAIFITPNLISAITANILTSG
eukprot:CAMPEP_0202694498 /NCGR_PEP_ID=MMETSP1385-20130828/8345_1 /ASSEMBLY_ACC=CAM_ASM_000861 /TAXON_ID=933848 /ORGANISM="Elphidium margaritaceum" /LENGTH=1708 /DNA_ID=CAMNT_0049350357 /DNA_START=54 /DNA_END=5180 /DNA_ORIENTATION=+